MDELAVTLFSEYSITLNGQQLALRSAKARALLAYLLSTSPKSYARGTLMTLFWPDASPEAAQTNLRNILAQIRKIFRHGSEASLLITDRKIVSLNPALHYEVDVIQFEQLLSQSPTISEMEAAIGLYKGDFLADFFLPDSNDFEQWVSSKRPYYRQQALTTLDTLTSHFFAQQKYAQAHTYAWQQLEIDPLRERACQQLIMALTLTGQRSTALAEYERFRQRFWDELRLEPSQETADLYQQIQNDEIRSLDSEQKPAISHLKSRQSSRIHLPKQSTSFIGRNDELAELQQFLEDAQQRMVTIVGPGGMGKTRLALALAEHNLTNENNFPNGIIFVNLAPLSAPGQMVPALADALNFKLAGSSQDSRPPKQQILDYLREKRLLLLMDNFEHLLDGAEFVMEILDAAPSVKILATSRERLHLRLEQVYPIQGLAFPDWEAPEDAADYTAVQLFYQSARRSQPDFVLEDSRQLTYLARICHLVDGMPLALELAAAWVDSLSLADIANEIQTSLDFLETEMRDLPERHRSIRASINSSWQKLRENERAVFAQCSVFRGGFTQKAGRVITGASLRTFSRLVNKSFLQFDHSTQRYQVQELMRQFGAEILAKDAAWETAVCDQHSNYYLQALADRTEDLKGARAKEAYEEITADFLNVYRAWHWGVYRHHFEQLNEALFSLWLHAMIHSSREYKAAIKAAVDVLETYALTPTQQLFLSRLLIMLGYLGSSTEKRHQTLAKVQPLLDALADSSLDIQAHQAEFWRSSAYLALDDGRYDDASRLLKESLSIYQEQDDKWYQSRVLLKLGAIAEIKGQQEISASYYQKSLSLRKSIGDEHGMTSSLRALITSSLIEGNYKQRREIMMTHLETAREFGDHRTEPNLLAYIGFLFLCEARPEEALPYYQEALAIIEEMGYENTVPWAFYQIAVTLMCLDKMNDAAIYIHKGLHQVQKTGPSRLINEFLYLRSILHLDHGQFDLAFEDAQMAYSSAKKQGDLIELATIAVWLAWLNVTKSNFKEAEGLIYNSLSKRLVDSNRALELTAYLLVRRDPRPENLIYAWQLLSLYERFPIFRTFLPIQKLSQQFMPTALAAMSAAEIEAAKASARALDWQTVIDDLIENLPNIGWGEQMT